MSDFIDNLFHKIHKPFWTSLLYIGIPYLFIISKPSGTNLPTGASGIVILSIFEFYFAIFYAAVALTYFIMKYLQRV